MNLNHLNWGHLLGGTAALILPLSLYAPKGLAPLFIILAAAAIGFSLFHKNRKPVSLPGRGLLVLILALPVLGAVSALWSPSPMSSLKSALIIGGFFLAGLLIIKLSLALEDRERHFIGKSIIVGGLIGYGLLIIEQATNAGLTRFLQELVGRLIEDRMDYTLPFNQGMSIAVLYLWPFGVTLFQRLPFRFALPILAVCAVSIFLSQAEAPFFALIVGSIVMILVRLLTPIMPKALMLAVVIGVLIAPMIPSMLPDPRTESPSLTTYSNSTIHRFIIWHTAQEYIFKKPLLGGGLNSTRFLYSKKDRVAYRVDNPETGLAWGVFSEPIPLHPHNAILQVWMELGLLGAVWFAVFLVTVLNQLRLLVLPRLETAACFAFFTSALTIESISYGAWQSWWLSGLWLSSALVVSTLSLGRTGEASTA